MYNLKSNLNIDKAVAVSMLNERADGRLFLHRFLPLLTQSIEDSNAILLRVKEGFFSSRPLNSEEYSLVTNSLISLGHKNFIYSWYAKDVAKPDMVLFDAFSDDLGSLEKIKKDIKELPIKLKIVLGVSYFDRDRVVIVKDKFWDSESQKPKGVHHIDDVI